MAYRVLRLLEWLVEKKHTLEELNARFREEPLTLKTLSPDTVGLYINTLRQVGCQINRPSKRNQYAYELVYQPFGLRLTVHQAKVLADLKDLGAQCDSISIFWAIQQFLHNFPNHCTPMTQERLKLGGLSQSRMVEYDNQLGKVSALEATVQREQLLWVTYHSPVKGRERFYFLPTQMYYEEGALFLQGVQKSRKDPVVLRLDRIEKAEGIDSPTPAESRLLQALIQESQKPQSEVMVRIYEAPHPDCVRWNMEEAVYQETPTQLLVKLQSNDWFRIRQKILTLGKPFEVLAPQEFRREVATVLDEMEACYAKG